MTGDVVKKSAARKNPSKKPKSIRIEESPNKEKKLVAYFYDKDGKKFRTVHFGARGMSDFTQHKDPKRKKNYLARHGGMGENWKDPMTAGALSRWILWGKPSLRESFNDFKKRFKLKGVMAVTNTKMNPLDEDEGIDLMDLMNYETSPEVIEQQENALNDLPRKSSLREAELRTSAIRHQDEEEYSATHLNGGVGLFVGALRHEEHIGEIAKSLDEVILVDPSLDQSPWRDSLFKQVAPDTKSTAFGMSIEEYLDNHELPELSLVHFPHAPSSPYEHQGQPVEVQLEDESVLARINEHTNESTIFFNVPGHERTNPHHCPIEVEARRAASDPSFKHHEWYIEHHLDYVMAIAHSLKPTAQPDEIEVINHMVWMHDYPKMLGDNDNFELVRDLVAKHKGQEYADELVGFIDDMERIKSPDWNGKTTLFGALMSTADALAHYYGPFWQIYLDENPDTPIAELKKSNAEKLEKDKNKLRAGPMKDGLEGVKFQYKGRKVRVVGNEHIAEIITRKNPKAPGYNSYAWTTQDWRSIKVNNKGDIDYSEKCGAEGTKTPSGSPRLCLPAEVVRSLLRTESGKDVIRTQARKKARAEKGERVPWHPRIKKIWKRVEDQTPKTTPH